MIEPVIIQPSTMFSGKQLLHAWLERYQCETKDILSIYGREKFEKVYYWLMKFVGNMHWDQWLVVEKISPDASNRRLFYYCMELIYQSSLIFDMKVDVIGNETRFVVVAPSEERRKQIEAFVGDTKYILNDYYSKVKYGYDGGFIHPSLFGFDTQSEQMDNEPVAEEVETD